MEPSPTSPDDATAYSHRSANFSVVALGAGSARLDAAWRGVAEHAEGMYLSFDSSRAARADLRGVSPRRPSLACAAIKAQVDPAGVFRDNFAIDPAVADAA